MLYLNLKEDYPNVEVALAVVEIEIENAKKSKEVALKVLHGYGSHGKGGVICRALRKKCAQWKRSGVIKDYILGSEYHFSNPKVAALLQSDKSIYDDDLYSLNPGITVIIF